MAHLRPKPTGILRAWNEKKKNQTGNLELSHSGMTNPQTVLSFSMWSELVTIMTCAELGRIRLRAFRWAEAPIWI